MVAVGSIVEGKVVSVMKFGAFVDIGNNQSGLVHISEISQSYVTDINKCVKKGDKVKVKVIKIDENGKINLSIKQAGDKKTKASAHQEKKGDTQKTASVRPAEIDWGEHRADGLSFEDKLSKFKQDSDEKMQTLRRNNDSKRSGGYSRKNNHLF